MSRVFITLLSFCPLENASCQLSIDSSGHVFLCVYLSFVVINYPFMANPSTYQIEPWLSVEEVAKHLGVSKESIYRWLERKTIRSHRVGKLWKFKASEVDQWVMSGGASSTSNEKPLLLGEETL